MSFFQLMIDGAVMFFGGSSNLAGLFFLFIAILIMYKARVSGSALTFFTLFGIMAITIDDIFNIDPDVIVFLVIFILMLLGFTVWKIANK